MVVSYRISQTYSFCIFTYKLSYYWIFKYIEFLSNVLNISHKLHFYCCFILCSVEYSWVKVKLSRVEVSIFPFYQFKIVGYVECSHLILLLPMYWLHLVWLLYDADTGNQDHQPVLHWPNSSSRFSWCFRRIPIFFSI